MCFRHVFEMKTIKKKRSFNWSEQEKELLRKLVLQRASIIENKKTNSNINRAKKIAWEEITSRFNAVNSMQRDVIQLQTQWWNSKRLTRKQILCEGSPRPNTPTEEEEVIPQEFTIEFENLTNINDICPKITSDVRERSSSQSSSIKVERQEPKYKSNCCAESHEHQLFMLEKTAREEALLRDKESHKLRMMHERELHERRMKLMSLQEEYWNNKIRIS